MEDEKLEKLLILVNQLMFSGVGDDESDLSMSPRVLEDECDLRYANDTSNITSTSFLYCASIKNNQFNLLCWFFQLIAQQKDKD